MESSNTPSDPQRGGRDGLTRAEMIRRGAIGGSALVGLPALLAACGDDSDGGGGALTGGSSTSTGASTTSEDIVRGGTLRAGITTSPIKSLDAHTVYGWSSDARIVQLYDPLVQYDNGYELQNILAEEVTMEQPDQWLIRVKEGVEFHDGKTLGADDVIATIQRICDPKTAAWGASSFANVDPNALEKMDERTVRMKLKSPDVTIADALANWTSGVIPVGYDPEKPIGTGPFKLESFTPGERSTQVRFDNYFQEGMPYLDQVEIIDFADDTARVNALLSNQVDVIDHVPLAQVKILEGRGMQILNHEGGGQWLPITMRVDQAPFDDNRVRQAFRLIANRQEIINSAISGYGRIGNDLFAVLDPAYNSDLPQREQDLDQAKSLLKDAGATNLKVELMTTPGATGMVESAQVYAQQAKAAGVTITVRKVDASVFYGEDYTHWTFANNFWGTRNYLGQVAAGLVPKSGNNETNWPGKVPEAKRHLELYQQALGESDDGKRTDIIHEMQKIEYDFGGYLIWGFSNLVDGLAAKVQGLAPHKGQLPLSFFDFKRVWFKS